MGKIHRERKTRESAPNKREGDATPMSVLNHALYIMLVITKSFIGHNIIFHPSVSVFTSPIPVPALVYILCAPS